MQIDRTVLESIVMMMSDDKKLDRHESCPILTSQSSESHLYKPGIVNDNTKTSVTILSNLTVTLVK